MKFQASGSRRQFLSTIAMTAGAAILLRPRLSWAGDITDPRVAGIVAKKIGIDTHNHIDVPLTAAETPGPNLDLGGELKRSGLSAICMTFATDYQTGDAYDRFLKGLASTDRQLERNGMRRSLTPDNIRIATVYYKSTRNRSALIPDYYLKDTEHWLVFPHEIQGLSREEILAHKPVGEDFFDPA